DVCSSDLWSGRRDVSTVAGVRVLICDDEADIRLLYRMSFEDLGAQVTEAADGQECVDVAADACPDLVVLDLFMSRVKDLRQIRGRESWWSGSVGSARAAWPWRWPHAVGSSCRSSGSPGRGRRARRRRRCRGGRA